MPQHKFITASEAWLGLRRHTLHKNLDVYPTNAITPTKEFQISHYRKRDFVALVLEGCSDKETAFLNWMDRDFLFAREVRRQCHKENYVSVINDGNMDLDKLAGLVAAYFGLK